jgi:hypothetical protein
MAREIALCAAKKTAQSEINVYEITTNPAANPRKDVEPYQLRRNELHQPILDAAPERAVVGR